MPFKRTATTTHRSLPAWVLPVLGVVCLIFAAINIWGATQYQVRAVSASGKVIEHHLRENNLSSVIAQVEVTIPGSAPFRTEVEDLYSQTDWQNGDTMRLRCVRIHADHLSCQFDSWTERWLPPLVWLGLGIMLMGWSARKRMKLQAANDPGVAGKRPAGKAHRP